jgi:hypothetical protein
MQRRAAAKLRPIHGRQFCLEVTRDVPLLFGNFGDYRTGWHRAERAALHGSGGSGHDLLQFSMVRPRGRFQNSPPGQIVANLP